MDRDGVSDTPRTIVPRSEVRPDLAPYHKELVGQGNARCADGSHGGASGGDGSALNKGSREHCRIGGGREGDGEMTR